MAAEVFDVDGDRAIVGTVFACFYLLETIELLLLLISALLLLFRLIIICYLLFYLRFSRTLRE